MSPASNLAGMESPAAEAPEAGGVAGDLGGRVARNLGALAAGRGAAALLQLAAFAVIAAHLGPQRLGVYAFAVAVVALFRLVPTFGFDQIVPRDIAQSPDAEARLVPNVVYARVLLAGVAYGLLAASLVAVGYDVRSREAALIAGGALVLVAGETMRAPLATRLRLGWAAVADVVEAAVTLGGAVALAARGSSIEPFLLLYVGAKLANVLIVAATALAVASYRWRPMPRLWWTSVRAAAPLAAATLVITIYYRLDIVILARVAPTHDVGQYGMALKFLDGAVLFTAVVISVLQPVLARSYRESREVLQRRYASAIHLMSTLAVATAVAGSMTGWRLVPALPGLGEYDGAGVALSLLAFAAAIILVTTVVQATLLAAHGERTLLRISLVGLAVNIGLLAVLIPLYSYLGAAIATTLTEAVLIVVSLAAVRRLGLRWPLERAVPLAIATVALVGVLLLGYLLHPIIQLVLGLAAFTVAAVATGAVRRDELGAVLRRSAP